MGEGRRRGRKKILHTDVGRYRGREKERREGEKERGREGEGKDLCNTGFILGQQRLLYVLEWKTVLSQDDP